MLKITGLFILWLIGCTIGRTIRAWLKGWKPDIILGEPENPYMLRWYIIPRNRFFNIYLHHFLRSDEDRALHNHPWISLGMILKGEYIEHLDDGSKVHRRAWHPVFRCPNHFHRVELFGDAMNPDFNTPNYLAGTLPEKPVWTIFITGPKVQDWGFACPQGFRSHTDFLDTTRREDGVSTVGRGCD